ncbi:protein LITTLE ZIPPER 3 [Morus notabilis]|uniref:protein LITTLE ZIPPER 3 n=1 Tax=Morus notabilis TaxID=981085 RepID=UPI000CED7F1B|nr:protein LITTLE ZIPPER 3 [Morus notabilis]
MCMNSSERLPGKTFYSSFRRRRLSKRYNLRVHGLNRLRKLKKGADYGKIVGTKVEMEINNLKLYMENQSIMEENQKLRKKALLLHQENQALLSQLQQKFSQPNNGKSTINNGQHNNTKEGN